MLDFAKSIVTGNASGIKEFNTEADLRRWCIEHQYAYTPTHGGYYRLEDDKPGRNRPDLAAHVKAGNSKIGNSSKSEIIEKKKKEGATLKVDNGQKLEFSDGSTYVRTSFSDDYREAHNYVGNASGTYNKLETEIRYAISEATVASKILSGNFSATNIISALSHCKQCCDNAIKLAQEYDHEINK